MTEEIKTGKVVTDSLRIRSAANTNATVLGSLSRNDEVTGVVDANGWWDLRSWKRNGVTMTLPASPCYASGGNGSYIQVVNAPPPSGDVEISVTHSMEVDGVTYVPASGNPIRFVRQ